MTSYEASYNNGRQSHFDAAADQIDHHPGTQAEFEEAARRGHLTNVKGQQAQAASGTVNLLHRYGREGKDNVVLVPAPTADPQDPLNLSLGRRLLCIVLLQTFASFGTSAVSAFNIIQPFLEDEYINQEGKNEQDLLNLSVMPTLSMGLANLGVFPLVFAIGRRPVYLILNCIFLLACFLAANSQNYEQHLAYRLMMGISVGTAQSLVPLMVKELFFLHQRGTYLAWSGTLNSILGLAWNMFCPNIVGATGWRNLYYIDASIAGLAFVTGIFMMPETQYNRPVEAYNGLGFGKALPETQPTGDEKDDEKNVEGAHVENVASDGTPSLIQITQLTRPDVDEINYRPRTLMSDLRPFQRKPDWKLAFTTFKQAMQFFLFPNILILCCLNFFFLMTTIVHGATYPRILIGPAWGWKPDHVGYIAAGGILDILLTPVVGYTSDYLIKFFAARRHGVHEPEVRVLPLLVPALMAVISMITHGYHIQNPGALHWFHQVWVYGALNFGFSAIVVSTQGILLDAYPTRSAAGLICVNTFRGAMAFAFMSGFGKIIGGLGGPFKAWGAFAGFASIFLILTGGLFFYGKKIRLFTLRFVVDVDRSGGVKLVDS